MLVLLSWYQCVWLIGCKVWVDREVCGLGRIDLRLLNYLKELIGPGVIVDYAFSLSFLDENLLENFRLQLIGEVVWMVELLARDAETFPLVNQLDPGVELLCCHLLKRVVFWLDLLGLLFAANGFLEEYSECIDDRRLSGSLLRIYQLPVKGLLSVLLPCEIVR